MDTDTNTYFGCLTYDDIYDIILTRPPQAPQVPTLQPIQGRPWGPPNMRIPSGAPYAAGNNGHTHTRGMSGDGYAPYAAPPADYPGRILDMPITSADPWRATSQATAAHQQFWPVQQAAYGVGGGPPRGPPPRHTRNAYEILAPPAAPTPLQWDSEYYDQPSYHNGTQPQGQLEVARDDSETSRDYAYATTSYVQRATAGPPVYIAQAAKNTGSGPPVRLPIRDYRGGRERHDGSRTEHPPAPAITAAAPATSATSTRSVTPIVQHNTHLLGGHTHDPREVQYTDGGTNYDQPNYRNGTQPQGQLEVARNETSHDYATVSHVHRATAGPPAYIAPAVQNAGSGHPARVAARDHRGGRGRHGGSRTEHPPAPAIAAAAPATSATSTRSAIPIVQHNTRLLGGHTHDPREVQYAEVGTNLANTHAPQAGPVQPGLPRGPKCLDFQAGCCTRVQCHLWHDWETSAIRGMPRAQAEAFIKDVLEKRLARHAPKGTRTALPPTLAPGVNATPAAATPAVAPAALPAAVPLAAALPAATTPTATAPTSAAPAAAYVAPTLMAIPPLQTLPPPLAPAPVAATTLATVPPAAAAAVAPAADAVADDAGAAMAAAATAAAAAAAADALAEGGVEGGAPPPLPPLPLPTPAQAPPVLGGGLQQPHPPSPEPPPPGSRRTTQTPPAAMPKRHRVQ